MENWILGKILAFVSKKLDGYKTKLGGVGFILLGILGLLKNIFPDQPKFPTMDIGTAIGSISAGVTALGVAGKAEKLTAAVKQSAIPVKSTAKAPPQKQNPLMSKMTQVTK